MRISHALATSAAVALLAGCPAQTEKSPTKKAPTKAAASKPAKAAASQPAKAAASQPAKAAASQPAKAAAPAGGDLVVLGKAQFQRACVNCHGMDGTGSAMRSMMPKIGNLTSAETHDRLSDADITALITNGRGKMPALGAVLKPDQIKAIVAYIRTLKR